MKKITKTFIVIGASILVGMVVKINASISWTPSYVQIPPNVSSNIVPTTKVQIGTFYISPPQVYIQTTNGVVNDTTNFYAQGRMSFDGTNWYLVSQVFQSVGASNTLFGWTNTSFPVYGSIVVTNGGATTNGVSITSP